MRARLAAFSLTVLAVAALASALAALRGGDDDGTPGPPVMRSAAAGQVALLEQRLRDEAADDASRRELTAAYLVRARETGDPTYYSLADETLAPLVEGVSPDPQVLVLAGTLALARHDFAAAQALGERARDANPDLVAAYGVLTDAYAELGRYDEALAAAQAMVDRRPDFASYSRVSYLRELHGDLDGAIAAMEQAVAAGSGLQADGVWGRVLLGNLHLTASDTEAAALAYEGAIALDARSPIALAGLARLAIARGDEESAEEHLRAALDLQPLPEHAIALGDLLASQGLAEEADNQYALVRATQQLFAANGVDTEIELALFDADHGVAPADTLSLALSAYARRPSIYGADTVAWAAYSAGDLERAREYSALATRLGTRDPRLAYHAGLIALASGEDARGRALLRDAIAAPGLLSPRDVALASSLLAAEASQARH